MVSIVKRKYIRARGGMIIVSFIMLMEGAMLIE